MKSKIYSSEYMKSSSKGQRWIPAFAMIAFLLAFPVAELILMGKWNERSYTQSQLSYLYSSLWSSDFLTMGAVVAAVTALFGSSKRLLVSVFPEKSGFLSQPSGKAKCTVSAQSIVGCSLLSGAICDHGICCGMHRGSQRILQPFHNEKGTDIAGAPSPDVSSGVFFHSAGDRLHRYHADGSTCMGRIVYLQYHSGSDAAVKRTFIF